MDSFLKSIIDKLSESKRVLKIKGEVNIDDIEAVVLSSTAVYLGII